MRGTALYRRRLACREKIGIAPLLVRMRQRPYRGSFGKSGPRRTPVERKRLGKGLAYSSGNVGRPENFRKQHMCANFCKLAHFVVEIIYTQQA